MKHSVSRPRPFLPSDLPRVPPGRSFYRAAFAIGKNALEPIPNMRKGADALAEERWPNDKVAFALTKAATSPALTTSGTWAGSLAPTATADFLGSLVGESAAAKLIDVGMRVDLSGVNSVTIPHRSTNIPAVDTQWVAEGGPFPVKQYTLATSTLGPVRKLASSVVLSREMAEASGGEDIFATLLKEDIAASLDASVFSNAAASASRPAGILNGISALTATTGGGSAALAGDLAKLAVVATNIGSGDVVFAPEPGLRNSARDLPQCA